MGRMALRVWLLLLIFGLGSPAGWAQEKPAQQPQQQQRKQPAAEKPKDTRVAPPAAAIPPLSTEKTKGQPPAAAVGQPSASSQQEQKPLTGAEQYTLSMMGSGHNYFYPLFQVAESGNTNGNNQFGSTTFETVSTISGAFSLNHVWSRYNFSANYAGSGFIYNRDPSMSSSAHTFSLSQRITGIRSSFLVTDAVNYLPEAAFGYARFGNFGGIGVGGMNGIDSGNLNGIYVPNQSILTGDSTRVSNAAVGEYDYSLSPLSSLTFTGAYSLLRFPDSGFINSNAGIFGMGYNHRITSRDKVAITYMGSVYRYDQSSNDFTNHIVAIMYGHQISHLLSLSLGGGPQVNMFGSAANNDTSVSWYATASLAYHLQRTEFSLYYMHYTSGGAGVFLGSKTDKVDLTIDRQLSRMWAGDVSMGYSHNQNLQGTTTSPTSPTFNTWYASANLQRPLGQYMNVFLSYNLQQQSSANPYCIGSNCGTFYTRNYFSLGFNWHPRATELGGAK